MFVLEGNIGAGKSTLLRKLQAKYPEISVFQEPVDEWIAYKNDNDQSIFQLFYEDPKRYAFAFQMFVMLTRLKKVGDYQQHLTSVYERSIMTDKNVFMDSLKKDNTVTDIEYKVFNDWFDYLSPKLEDIQGIIYLRVEPNECYNRIQKRNRTSENNISIEYLTTIHDRHETWLSEKKNTECVVVDGNDDADLQKIYDFITKTTSLRCHNIWTS